MPRRQLRSRRRVARTYQQGATPPCHAYGLLDEQAANALAARLRTQTPPLTVMVLPLEAPPAA